LYNFHDGKEQPAKTINQTQITQNINATSRYWSDIRTLPSLTFRY